MCQAASVMSRRRPPRGRGAPTTGRSDQGVELGSPTDAIPQRFYDSALNVIIQRTRMSTITKLGGADISFKTGLGVQLRRSRTAGRCATSPLHPVSTRGRCSNSSPTPPSRNDSRASVRSAPGSPVSCTTVCCRHSPRSRCSGRRYAAGWRCRRLKRREGIEVLGVALRDARSTVWDMRALQLEERDVAATLVAKAAFRSFFFSSLIDDMQSSGVERKYTVEAALDALLANSAMTATLLNPGPWKSARRVSL